MQKSSHPVLQFILISSLILIIFVVASIGYFEQQLPEVEALKTVKMQEPLRIYTRDNQLIAEFGEMRRRPVPLEEIPIPLIDAIIATEDQRYFEHPGVDVWGLLRAGIELSISGKKTQGGSTITMQVARNFFLTRDKTFSRKIREILLSLKISRELDKEKVLELYLNQVYLGNRAYGVAAAAQIYYGKNLNQLNLSEMATLAGLPKAPSLLNPVVNPRAAKERRQHVLDRMLELAYISKPEFLQAKETPIQSHYHGAAAHIYAPYVAEMVRNQIITQYGNDAYTSGLRVYTTIDGRLQEIANSAVHRAVEDYMQRHPKQTNQVQAALVSLNPQNGAVLALVGGYNFEKSNFNRVYQAQRQPGSSFKPLLYAAALDKGMTMATIINDAPFTARGSSSKDLWEPQNEDRLFMGPIRLRTALTLSRNLVSVRLLQNIGIGYALNYFKRFGFNLGTLPRNLSLSLGSGDVYPIQMAVAFSVFANGGYKINDYLIERIEDNQEKILYKAEPLQACERCITAMPGAPEPTLHNRATRVLSAQTAYLITSGLQSVIQEGTGRAATVLERSDLAGKTGTTNDWHDAWFNGFNSDIETVAWMGFDQPESLYEYGSQTALPLWINFMRQALQGTALHTLPRPPGLVSVKINPTTGELASPNEQNAIFETFVMGTEPGGTGINPALTIRENNLPLRTIPDVDDSVYGSIY